MIDEPIELRDHVRAFAAVAPRQARAQLAREVAVVVADAFQTAVEADGTKVDVEGVCDGYERELWLWLVGERSWQQCMSGLSGRLQRRAGTKITGAVSV